MYGRGRLIALIFICLLLTLGGGSNRIKNKTDGNSGNPRRRGTAADRGNKTRTIGTPSTRNIHAQRSAKAKKVSPQRRQQDSIEDHENFLWNIPMPNRSLFFGFPPPRDITKWKNAQLNAMTGHHLLFEKVQEALKHPMVVLGDNEVGHYRWIHKLADVFSSSEIDLAEIINGYEGDRAPITMFGYVDFSDPRFEGKRLKRHWNSASDVLGKQKKIDIPKKIVAIGMMNENWGWASSYFLNRTLPNSYHLDEEGADSGPLSGRSQTEELAPFLDHPNITALFVNQHHNISHPKIISVPLGVLKEHAKIIWDEALRARKHGLRKNAIILSATSTWGPRPAIIKCVQKKVGSIMKIRYKLSPKSYIRELVYSRATLCLPGLGYDTYRIWETLLAGAMPVLERAVGLDRTLYKLPALLLEDFTELTPTLLRQAYVEALYRKDEWDYRRLTQSYWERLIYAVSESGNASLLLKKHPMISDDNFTRPMVPFDCVAMGGCGKGTKRTPRQSCAIDATLDLTQPSYKWDRRG